MDTLQPTLRLGRDVWDRTAMPIAEFLDRTARLRRAMSEAGLDALLLYGSGLNSCGHPTYVSNYIVKLPFSALVVVPRNDAPALMFEGATRGRAAAQATTWIEDVRPCWNMAETCLEVLAERNLLTARIGVAGMPRLVPHAEWAALTGGLGQATVIDAEDLVNEQRTIKSAREIAQVRTASQIVNVALQSLPALDEVTLAAHVIRAARMQGAEDVRLMIARTAEDDWALRPPEPGPIAEGKPIAISLCASWERYWSEATRTYVVRGGTLEPVDDARIDERRRAIARSATPGVAVSEFVRSIQALMTPAERRAVEPYGFGHGIGITPEERPTLSADSSVRLASGMCLVCRTAVRTTVGLALHADTLILQ